jgi:hypothetical protein
MVANLMLENEAVKEVLSKAAACQSVRIWSPVGKKL